MAKASKAPASFETALAQLEDIIQAMEAATCRWKRRSAPTSRA